VRTFAGGAGSTFAVDFHGGRRFPVQQRSSREITSPIRQFLVQRGSRVRQGQVLAILENKDLAAAAGQSKGEFEQAEAGYATTVVPAFPSRCMKAELDTAASKEPLTRKQKLYDSRKELYSARRASAR